MKVHHSAGGAVLARQDGCLMVALIRTHGNTRYGLPKGTIDEGEVPEQTAVREVREETGLSAEVLCHLDEIDYHFKAHQILIHKYVDFYLMRYTGGDLVPQLEEVDDAVWIPVDRAVSVLSFDSERRVIERARLIWSELSSAEREEFGSLPEVSEEVKEEEPSHA